MLTPKNAVEVNIVARLGENPHYRGSIHDDAGARKFGYERALVPGAFIYGYISRLAVATWERDWLRSGTISSHSRKPVFDGERLTLHAGALEDDGVGLRSDIVVRNSKGEDVASGFVALPHQPPSPPSIADYTVVPMAESPPFVDAGAMRIGDPIFSNEAVFTLEEHRTSLADFGETWPDYVGDGIVHAGYLMRRSVGDGVRSYSHPTPGIYVRGHGQYFDIAHVGDRLVTAGRVVEVYERKGSHYYDSDQILIANGERVIARFRRSSIYAVRRNAA